MNNVSLNWRGSAVNARMTTQQLLLVCVGSVFRWSCCHMQAD
ncbi:hypothetical protein F443_22926 [Phytophthora nicotianae P1569]|uniref:Uncharacterized protein n=2 Tax=Phytophthora nicotianae TaxID=4792 RepID=V9DSU0_PHYNI|nr:hypothetical protein F443_22926 [Phytophthora nicotianae P1569]ETO76337.1 hypothetical protein F444_08246 [Phytophthora nicotianae P1976]